MKLLLTNSGNMALLLHTSTRKKGKLGKQKSSQLLDLRIFSLQWKQTLSKSLKKLRNCIL